MASPRWASISSQLVSDLSKIPGKAFDVVDMGCICLDAGCTVSDCGGTVSGAMPIYKSVQQPQDIKLSGNIYYRREGPGRYVNRCGLRASWQSRLRCTCQWAVDGCKLLGVGWNRVQACLG